MSDVVSLDLELVNKASQPAKGVADALRLVERQAQKTQDALNKVSGQQTSGKRVASAEREAQRVEQAQVRSSIAAMRATQRAMQEEDRATKKREADVRRLGLMQLQAAKMNAAMDKKKGEHGGFLSAFREKLPFRSLGDYAKGAFWGDLAAEGVVKIVEGLAEGAKKAVEIMYDGIKDAFKAGADYEQTKLNYRFLLGKRGGAEAMEDIGRFSGKTRYDDDEIMKMMRPLYNAGLRGTGARSAFAAAGDLNAAGLGDTQDFIEQLARIKLKGGVQGKQLVGMGVNVPEFAKALAKSLGTDTKTAMDRAKEGKVDPQLLLNTIYEGIEKRQGGKLGTATEAMGATMGARWHKLSMLPEDVLKRVSDVPAWDALSTSLGNFIDSLGEDTERGKRINSAVQGAFSRIADMINQQLTPEKIDTLVDAVVGLAKATEILASMFLWVADKLTSAFGSFGRSMTGYEATKELGGGSNFAGAMAAGDIWSKVREHYGVGWLEGQTLGEDKTRDLLSRASDENVISSKQASSVYTSFYGKQMGGAIVDQRGMQIIVQVPEGQDPKEAGQRFSDGMNASTVRHLERAMQERGGD